MLIPISFITLMTLGLTSCVSMPPECTFHSSPKIAFSKTLSHLATTRIPCTNKINGLFGYDKPLYL